MEKNKGGEYIFFREKEGRRLFLIKNILLLEKIGVKTFFAENIFFKISIFEDQKIIDVGSSVSGVVIGV